MFTYNCGQKGKRSGLELVRKAKGKPKKNGKPVESSSKALAMTDGSLNALSPAHLLSSHTFHIDAEFQEVMEQRVMQQDFAGAADKIRHRVIKMGKKGHLLFQKYFLSLREK